MESVDSNLLKLINTNILVVGDVMLDQYWMGDVERISPEAPVPVVAVNDTEERVGGAGNVARNITALGGRCTLIGILGDDEAGQSVDKITAESNIQTQMVLDNTIKTTIKLRVISKNQQLLRADFENTPSNDALEKMTEKYRESISDHNAVVLSDYGKGGLSRIESLIKIAKDSGKPVFVDPKGGDYSRYHGATMITPNLKEFESAAGAVRSEEELREKAKTMMDDLDLIHLLVTLSDKGMALFSANADSVRVPARSREVYDVSGAGDTVVAVMAMALSSDLPNSVCVEIANSAAGIVISKLGTATTTKEELQTAIQRDYQS